MESSCLVRRWSQEFNLRLLLTVMSLAISVVQNSTLRFVKHFIIAFRPFTIPITTTPSEKGPNIDLPCSSMATTTRSTTSKVLHSLGAFDYHRFLGAHKSLLCRGRISEFWDAQRDWGELFVRAKHFWTINSNITNLKYQIRISESRSSLTASDVQTDELHANAHPKLY